MALITLAMLNISTNCSMYQNQKDFFGQLKTNSLVQSDNDLKKFWNYSNNGMFIYPTPAPNAILNLNLYLHVCSSVFRLNVKRIETNATEEIEELHQNPKLSLDEKYTLSETLIKQTVQKTSKYKNKILSAINSTCNLHMYWIRDYQNQQTFIPYQ